MTNTYTLNENIPPFELVQDIDGRESKRSSEYYITVEAAIQLSKKSKKHKQDFTPSSTRKMMYSNRFFVLASLLLYSIAIALFLVWKYLISQYLILPSPSAIFSFGKTAHLTSITQSVCNLSCCF